MLKKSRKFYFDLSHDTTHLGDRLFFLPLIETLIENGYSVTLSESDKITPILLNQVLGVTIFEMGVAEKYHTVVYPRPSYLNFRSLYPQAILVDFTDRSVNMTISAQLIRSFQITFSLDLELNEKKTLLSIPNSVFSYIDIRKKYYLFSNYINSGRFRRWFVDEGRMVKKIFELKHQGYEIIHVGSEEDIRYDNRHYDYVDLDLRGRIGIRDLIVLTALEQVEGAISYDNFLMHLVGIFDKQSFILFRGRFLKKNREHHIMFVNNTFYRDSRLLKYL